MSLQAAFDAFQRHDRSEARGLLRELLNTDPGNEDAWVLLMYVAVDDSERREAIEQTLALNPDNTWAHKFQAHMDDPSQGLPPPPQPPAPGTPGAGVRVYDEGVYEMLWDCQYCNAQKLLAKTHKFCPQCGGPQDTEARYFPSDDEKVAVYDHEYVGADVVCSACEAANPGNAEYCGQCGSPLTEAARAKRQTDQVQGADGAQFLTEPTDTEPANKSAGGGRGKLIAIGVVAVIVIGILMLMFWTKEVSVSVIGHSWEREVKIEDFAARSEGNWCESTPSRAYNIARSQKVRSHKKVPDGESCTTRRIDQGDGTFRQQRECTPKYRQEPIYDTWCDYRIDRWGYDRSVKAQGDDLAPNWPNVSLRCDNQPRRGCERVGGRVARYYLALQASDSGEIHQCDVAENFWQQAQRGSKWRMEIGAMTGGAHCDSLEPLR